MVQELYQCDAGDTVVLQEYRSVMQDLKKCAAGEQHIFRRCSRALGVTAVCCRITAVCCRITAVCCRITEVYFKSKGVC